MPSIKKIGAGLVGGTAKLAPVRGIYNYFHRNYEQALVYATIGSVVVKDGIGCAMYVHQSRHNKNIPEERRNFVAAQDLTNGVLMILSQLALFGVMHKFSEPIFRKVFSKLFDKDTRKILVSQVRMMQRANKESLAKTDPIAADKLKVSRKFNLHNDIDVMAGRLLTSFKFVADLVASTIIAKRIIVPLIATPLASVVEKRTNAKAASQKAESVSEVKKEDKTSQPAMQVATAQKPQLDIVEGTNLLNKYRK